MEDYPALHHYSHEQARAYESRRFRRLRGRTVDALEWLLVRRCVAHLEGCGGPLHTILDVPIGTGRMARRLRARGYNVTGLDASVDMLAMARRAHAAHAYEVGRAEHLPFPDESYDAVVSVRLFGHLPSGAQADALKEFHRVARRGAVVFFAGDTKWLRMRRACQGRRERRVRSWNPVSPSDMRALADQAGFRVLHMTGLLGPYTETKAVTLVPK